MSAVSNTSFATCPTSFTGDAKKPDWTALLERALTCPGELSNAYRMFHRFSAGNIAMIAVEAMLRCEPLGPIASFSAWKKLGYYVQRGAKAYAMVMPVQVHIRDAQDDDEDAGDNADRKSGATKTVFVLKRNWFMLHQVAAGDDAQPLQTPATPGWSFERACNALGIKQIAFELADGNVQGYACAQGVALNPLAKFPIKTAAHELAHILLGHVANAGVVEHEELGRDLREAEAESTAFIVAAMLGLSDDALSSSRAYIQSWLGGVAGVDAQAAASFQKRSAARVFKVATQILRAGSQADQAEQADA